LQKIIFPDAEFLTDEMKEQEKQDMCCLDEACLTVPDGDKVGFLLPSAGDGDSVTQFCVHVRYGKVFHLYTSFKPEAEIRAELSSFHFANVEGEELDEDSTEFKNLRRVRVIKELIASECCRAPNISTMLHAPLIFDVVDAGGSRSDDAKSAKHFPETAPEDVIICDRVRKVQVN
jgi:hypothetical protein